MRRRPENIVGELCGARRIGLRLDAQQVAHAVTQQAAGQETRLDELRQETVVALHGGGGRVADPHRRIGTGGLERLHQLAVRADGVAARSDRPGEREYESGVAEFLQTRLKAGQVVRHDLRREKLAMAADEIDESNKGGGFPGAEFSHQHHPAFAQRQDRPEYLGQEGRAEFHGEESYGQFGLRRDFAQRGQVAERVDGHEQAFGGRVLELRLRERLGCFGELLDGADADDDARRLLGADDALLGDFQHLRFAAGEMIGIDRIGCRPERSTFRIGTI
ncbi:MAG: hypothetical protein WDM96_05595 [Lacunisphaera sp.]